MYDHNSPVFDERDIRMRLGGGSQHDLYASSLIDHQG